MLLPADRKLSVHRLNKPSQFAGIANKGKRISVELLTLKYLSSPDGELRLAFVVRKKCGNAVFRNRVRRILREEFYSRLADFPQPWWGVLQYFGKASETNSQNLHLQARQLVDALLQRLANSPTS